MSPTATTKSNSNHNSLDPAALSRLAGQEHPCITMYLPDKHPGAAEGSRGTMARGMLRSAAERLGETNADLLGPIEALINSNGFERGGPGLAIFSAPKFFASYPVPGVIANACMIGSHFHIAPLVPIVGRANDFFILILNKKQLRLVRYTDGACEEAAWPEEVPRTMEGALLFDQPDHRMVNRSFAGSSAGNMAGVVFGTDTDRESAAAHLHNYFAKVDRGLRGTAGELPLVLAGVSEEVIAYRKAAQSGVVAPFHIDGNVDFLGLAELAGKATQAAGAHYYESGEKVLAAYRELKDRKRVRNGARGVYVAAVAGRVHQLCAAEGIEERGNLRPNSKMIERYGAEDMVNAAIVETLKAGGQVFALPAERMGPQAPLAAILRY